jgi:hypothetical protein
MMAAAGALDVLRSDKARDVFHILQQQSRFVDLRHRLEVSSSRRPPLNFGCAAVPTESLTPAARWH